LFVSVSLQKDEHTRINLNNDENMPASLRHVSLQLVFRPPIFQSSRK